MAQIEYHVPDLSFVYYLIIPSEIEHEYHVLLQQNGARWTLPQLKPQEHHFGVVKHINDYVWDTYNLHAVTLRCFHTRSIEHTGEQRFYVMDNLDLNWQLRENMQWFNEDAIHDSEDIDPVQRNILMDWFHWVHSDSSIRVAWHRPGWFDDVSFWMVDVADRMAIDTTQQVEQVRAWSRSCILRLEAENDKDLYLKAVPEHFSYEPVITRVLSIRYPKHMPDVRAVHVENGWMLMRDFGGTRLSDIKDMSVWKRVIRDFADIQVDLVGSTQSLVALGIPDRHVDYLLSQIDGIMVNLPDDLSEAEQLELRRFAPTLKTMCFELTEHNIPLSLTHGDFWAGNVVITSDDRTVFFDWSDASVSHPFFDVPFFIAEIERDLPLNRDAKAQLLDAYFDAWTRYEPKPNLRRAYLLAEVLGHLHMASFYRSNILPGVENNARWEMQNMLPMLLRQVMASVRTYLR